MKYAILVHSNPQPWGHPTTDFLAEYQDTPQDVRERLEATFEATLAELDNNGELVSCEPLADPASSRLYRWDTGQPLVSDGPYAEAKEHFAGFFLIDVTSQERAEEVAQAFCGPGETIELRPVMQFSGDEG